MVRTEENPVSPFSTGFSFVAIVSPRVFSFHCGVSFLDVDCVATLLLPHSCA
jgi:hypothetical protein